MKTKLYRGITLTLLALLTSCVVAPSHEHDTGYSRAAIGIGVSSYPDFTPVPGHPVYYASGLSLNLFFYDGLYWAFHDDRWHYSSWYNGPWYYVDIDVVPRVILQIPVRYYSQPPTYFRHWRADAPPRWNERWGRDWENRHRDWDRDWDKPDRRDHRALAPLPQYQQRYGGERYPHQLDRQRELRREHYSYQPRDPEVRRFFDQEDRRGHGPRRRYDEPRRPY